MYICCVSAFSREEAAHQTNPDEKEEKKVGEKNRADSFGFVLSCTGTTLCASCVRVGVTIRGCLFSEMRRVHYSRGVRILSGFALRKTHYK